MRSPDRTTEAQQDGPSHHSRSPKHAQDLGFFELWERSQVEKFPQLWSLCGRWVCYPPQILGVRWLLHYCPGQGIADQRDRFELVLDSQPTQQISINYAIRQESVPGRWSSNLTARLRVFACAKNLSSHVCQEEQLCEGQPQQASPVSQQSQIW